MLSIVDGDLVLTVKSKPGMIVIVKKPAHNYTFYMFYMDKNNGQSKGEKPIIH